METKLILRLKKFEDSTQATEVVDRLSRLLECPALVEWAKSTDANFNTKAFEKLCEASQAFDDFMEELDSAC